MPRTLEQVDSDLSVIVANRQVLRELLAKRTVIGDDRANHEVRLKMADERIERLLDERSQIKLLSELATL